MVQKAVKSVKGKVALAASAAMFAIALPSSVFAVGALHEEGGVLSGSQFGFTPAAADPDIAKLVAQSAGGQARMVRFTPAGAAASPQERSVTVAVRVDQASAQALSSSSALSAAAPESVSRALRISPVRYNLGLARGYGSFAQSSAPSAAPTRIATGESVSLSSALSNAKIPDLSSFVPRSVGRDEESRFAARVEMEGERPITARGDSRSSVSDQMLDVGGSYRLTRNLDITAGVRYEQDRDIVPLPDIDQQDSQAVYIGTQFRF